MTTCAKCGRPVGNYGIESCPATLRPWSATDANACAHAAAGFRVGIARGVELAKANARVDVQNVTDDGRDVMIARLDWTDVDKAAEAAGGGE